MKEFFRKALALGLALALALALAACGAKKDGGDPTPSPQPSETVDELESRGIDFLPDNEIDVAEKILGFPNDTVLLTVNGKGVTAEEYLYWLGNMTAYYEMMVSYYSGGYGGINFGEAIGEDGVTWDEQLKEIAYQNTLLLAVTPEAAAQYGVSLDDTDWAELIAQRESNIESAGSQEVYAYQLQAMGISDKAAFRLDQVSALFSKLQETYTDLVLNGSGPEAVTDEKMAEYLNTEGILRAKHILLLTKDMDSGEEYDDAKKAEQKAKAEDILSQLRADPSRFDELMNEYSEDSGLSTFPDGYLFGEGEMVDEFYNGTKALEVGGISGLIQSTYGYHIILRLDGDGEDSREDYATWSFNTMMQDLVDNAAVEKMAEYDSFTTETYYKALTEFQDSLEAPVVTEDKSDATLEPDTGDAPIPTEE